MRRRVLLLGLMLFLIEAASGKDVAAEPVNSIEAALRQHTELVVDRPQALRDVLAGLVRRHRIPVWLDEASFARSGIALHRVPPMELRNVTLRSALNTLIETVINGQSAAPILLERDGVLVIAASSEFSKPFPLSMDELARPAFREGTVQHADGRPGANALVQLRTYLNTTLAIADAEGRFRVAWSPVGNTASLVLASDESGRNVAYWTLTSALLAKHDASLPLKLTLREGQPWTVRVSDRTGAPVPNATAGFVCEPYFLFDGVTDAAGQFAVWLPEGLPVRHVYAWASQRGLDYYSIDEGTPARQSQRPAGAVQLTLEGARPLRLSVRDEADQPISRMLIYPPHLKKPDDPQNGFPLSHVTLAVVQITNERGETVFDWLPAWQQQPITLWAIHKDFARQPITIDPQQLEQGQARAVLYRLVDITGSVRDAAGQPVAGVNIHAVGAGYSLDSFRTVATSAADGTYTLKVSPHQIYLLIATDSAGRRAASRDGLVVFPGQPLSGIDLQLQAATRVFGRVTIGGDKAPLKGQRVTLQQRGKSLLELKDVALPNPTGSRKLVQPLTASAATTDDNGRFEFWVGPGSYDLRGPDQAQWPVFAVTDQRELEINFHADRPDSGLLRGRVVTGDPPRGVSRAIVELIERSTRARSRLQPEITDDDGQFQLTRGRFPSVVYARDDQRSLAGMIEIGADDEQVVLAIAPTATVTARFLDPQRQPLPAGGDILYGVRVHLGDNRAPFQWRFGGVVKVEEGGRATFSGLVVGAKYDIVRRGMDENSWQTITSFTPEEPGAHDIGTIPLQPAPLPAAELTLAKRIDLAFHKPLAARERLRAVLADIKLSHQHGLVTLADPAAELTASLYKAYFEHAQVRQTLYDFRTLAIPTVGERAAEAAELATDLGLPPTTANSPRIAIVNAEGNVLAWTSVADLIAEGGIVSPDRLLAFLQPHAPARLDARQLLEDALARARAENKRVLVQQTATWCGPCWLLSRFLDQHRPIWEKDYIWVKIDERWEHAREVIDPLRRGAEGGIPWMAILNAEGQVLVTSNGPDGENVGFPSASEPNGIRHFVRMFQTTAQRLTDDDLARLRKALETGS